MFFLKTASIKSDTISIPSGICPMSRTDKKGNIVYSNAEFKSITGYSIKELDNVNHGIIKHPDMPQVIHDLIWNNARAGKETKAIIKNRTKDGKTFWSLTEIRPLYRDKHLKNSLYGFSVMRFSVDKRVINEIESLYKQIKEIENRHGREGGARFFTHFLAKKNVSYQKYIQMVMGGNHSLIRRFVNLSSLS